MEVHTKPLILLGSARSESNTRKMLENLFTNREYQLIDLSTQNIEAFDYEANYSESDGFQKVIDQVLSHQTLVFSTPVYWYTMSGVMKNFFDRFTDLLTKNKERGRLLRGKRSFLVTQSHSEVLPVGFELPFKETSNYLGMSFEGFYFASASQLDTLPDREQFLEKVYAEKEELI